MTFILNTLDGFCDILSFLQEAFQTIMVEIDGPMFLHDLWTMSTDPEVPLILIRSAFSLGFSAAQAILDLLRPSIVTTTLAVMQRNIWPSTEALVQIAEVYLKFDVFIAAIALAAIACGLNI